MPKSCEATYRTVALAINQEQRSKDARTKSTAPEPQDKRRRNLQPTLNDLTAEPKSVLVQRRSESTSKINKQSEASFRTAQTSNTRPKNASIMASVNYTKTGRVSKAKKGLKVHNCECGRAYTRAEHLRRHQRNHAQEDAVFCKYLDCSKLFYRLDLLQRHEERHNEFGNASRQSSVSSTEHSAQPSPMPTSASLPMESISTFQPTEPYQLQQDVPSHPDTNVFTRYTPDLFRTPQLPRTPRVALSQSSSHLVRSDPVSKFLPNGQKHHNLPYQTQHSISGSVPMGRDNYWPESYAPSTYSCSSGYASPILGSEYNQTYATPPPYGLSVNRTRASSNASFVGPWVHSSQSPMSSVSNLQYSWPVEEKSMLASSFSNLSDSFSMGSMPMHMAMDPSIQYGHYCPNNVVQHDQEETALLFPGEHYGMSHPQLFERYLNNYWRLFHPAFPIVHQFTFASIEPGPILYAALVAIGAQYSDDAYDRRKALDLHKTCVMLLDKRDQLSTSYHDRLCDYQAIFLIEIFAQYRAQQCVRALSPRFISVFQKLIGIPGAHPCTIRGLMSLAPVPEHSVQDWWIQYTNVCSRHNLLLSCYILISQQTTLLARGTQPSLKASISRLPFPAHESIWNARTSLEWKMCAQSRADGPATIHEAIHRSDPEKLSLFQSAVFIAVKHTHFNSGASGLAATIDNFVNDSPATIHQLLITKLAQLVPVRALLAVSGESWVLGSKITSHLELSALRNTLQTWIGQIWTHPIEDHPQPAAEALRVSISILKQSFETSESLNIGIGSEMGLFHAGLVVWAATVAATSRFRASSFSSQQGHPQLDPLPENVVKGPWKAASRTPSEPAGFGSPHYASGLDQHSAAASGTPTALSYRCPVSRSKISFNASNFLTSAFEDITSLNITACQVGCTSLLCWTKMAISGTPLHDETRKPNDDDSNDGFRGGLINFTLGQIERMLDRGWEGWDI